MWWKKIRTRKLQNVLIILIIMICAMLMSSSVIIMTSFESPYQDLVKECQSPKVKLYLFEDTETIANQVKENFEKLNIVDRALVVKYGYVRDKVVYNKKELEGFFDLMPYTTELYGNVRMLEGTKDSLSEGECLISAATAYKNEMKLHDTIAVGEHTYKIKGIYTEPYNMSIAFDSEIIVSQIPDMETGYYVCAYSDSSGEDIIDAYREQNNNLIEGRAITLKDRIGNNQMTDKIMGGILLGMSITILLACGIMIQYIIKAKLIAEKKSIAIYKTIGYDNADIIGIYMKFYMFLAFIGSTIGCIGSKFISDAFTKETFKNLGVTTSNNILLANLFCIGIILAYVMLQVYVVLRRTKNIKPVEVFTGSNIEQVKVSAKSVAAIGFSPLQMAIRMLRREYKRTIIILITCIMSLYCVNFIAAAFSILKSMKDDNYYWIGFDKHDVSVTSNDLDSFPETLDELRSMKEVKRVIPTTTDVAVSLDWEKGMGDTIISSMIYESYENINMPTVEGRNPVYSDEIVIGSLLAKNLNKHVGDYINVYFNGTKKVTLLICGTCQGYYNMGKNCRLLGKTLIENGVDFQYSEASLYLKPGYDTKNFINTYSTKYKDKAVLTNRRDKYSSIMGMICDPQERAMKPFMGMALLLGALNIVAVVYLKNKDNSKVNSIYKAIGYSANHLLKANMWYIFLIALFSILITVPIFIVCFPKVMVLSLSAFGFKQYLVDYDVMIILACNSFALFVFLLSGIISSKTLYDNPVADLTCD